MKAIQITELTGPDTALSLNDVPEPTGDGVLIEVHAAGVAFPELLQTRGEYQMQPPLPFIPGGEVGGVVVQAPAGSDLKPGDQVAAFCGVGGYAEYALAMPHLTYVHGGTLSHTQAAGLILNYHTAYFSLITRGRLRGGETVVVQGAAGGVGTATLQVAKGLGARTIAVVSTPEKAEVARRAGADECVLASEDWKAQILELTGGGADMVVDPVGGDRFADSMRCLARGGRIIVVGFTDGQIPTVAANRVLLRNIDIVGAYWGGWILPDPVAASAINLEVGKLIAAGAVDPIVGQTFPLADAAQALHTLDDRAALGKVVLTVRGD